MLNHEITVGFSPSSALKGLLTIVNKNTRIPIRKGMSKGQTQKAYEEKAKLALDAAIFYNRHLKKNIEDWEHIPIRDLGQCVGLDASQPHRAAHAALEAGDYDDPFNQLGTLNGTLTLMRALPLYAYDYPELKAMWTDFSDTPGLFEQTETTRIITVPAIEKYNTEKDATGRPLGWSTVSAAQTMDASLTLTDYIGVPIVMGEDTLSSTNRRIFDEMAAAGMKAMGGYFTGMMTTLLTQANFNAYAAVTNDNPQTVPIAYATYPRSLQDFSMTDLDHLSAIFTQCKVPRSDRGILLNPMYYAKLRSDPRLSFFFAASQGNPMLTQQKLPDGLSGFFPYEAPYLPSTNNLTFFPFHKSGIILKSRVPTDFSGVLGVTIPGSVTIVTEPDTKMSVALVQYVNLTQNYAEWRPEVQLGVAKGDNRGGLCGTTS